MPPPANNHILLTGATGYIGGSALEALIKSPAPSLQSVTWDLLVRRQDQADKLRSIYGSRVNPMLWPEKGLNDPAWMADTAENYDLIVNAGVGFHANGGEAFIEGLARRLKNDGDDTTAATANKPWLIHLAGCTNLSDRPITQEAHPDLEWDDADSEAVYKHLRHLEAKEKYLQRTNELETLAAAEKTGVQAVSLNCPIIFGEGTGHFNKSGIMVPMTTQYVVEHGHGFKLNDTANFDWVHVADLADLYVLVVRVILERADRGVGFIPTGRRGIIFPAVARVLCTDIMQKCLDAAFEAGVLPRDGTPNAKEIRLITLEEAAAQSTGGDLEIAERGFAGHKAMTGTMARRLFGWNPSRLQDAWEQDFRDELTALCEGRRGALATLRSAMGKS